MKLGHYPKRGSAAWQRIAPIRAAEGVFRQGPNGEDANLRFVCMAQLTVRLTNLAAKLGHTPSAAELEVGDEIGSMSYGTIKWAFNMTFREALKSIGLNPAERGVHNKIASSTQLHILQLRARGVSYKEIAEQLSVHSDTARRYVAASGDAGLKRRLHEFMSESDLTAMREMRANGLNPRKIARILGVSHCSVWRHLKDNDLGA